MNQPKQIVISHVYSSANKGDAALTSVLIKDLRRQFPGAKLTILTLDSKTRGEFEGIAERPAFMYWALSKYRGAIAKLVYTVFMIPATLLWAALVRRTGKRLWLPKELTAIAELYAQADLIVGVGGGYIRSRSGWANRLNIPLLLHPLLFGYILGKSTALYSQSVGPFMAKYEERLVAYVLKRMTLILLREDISVALLSRLGVTQNVVRSVDSGFLLQASGNIDIRHTYNIPANTLILGVTVRSWLNGEAQTAYEKAVAGALDNIAADGGVHVLFIPQVTADKGDDDRIASRRVLDAMQHKGAATLITDELDHHRIKAIYDGLDILLGTRFHSVIFSLTSYVPVVAIEYEHKTSGIMRDLKLHDWVVPIEQVTAKQLTTLLRKLIKEQAQYRDHLHTHLPPYVQQAQRTVEILAERYAAATT